MAVFIFSGSLTKEDLAHLEEDGGAAKFWNPGEELGIPPHVLQHLTAQDIDYLREEARKKPPVFIDRNKINWELVDDVDHDGIHTRTCAEKKQIMELPAYACFCADVRPLAFADWKKTDAFPHWAYCSSCYKRLVPNTEWIRIYNIPTKYCPNCGATMRNPRFYEKKGKEKTE